MNSVISNVLLAADMALGERLGYAAQVLVIGMVTVFASLAILWGVIAIFKIFMYDMPQKRAKKKAEEALKAVAAPETAVPVAESAPAADESDDTQLIAVITAAISAYTSGNGNALPFRVVSYKRVRGANGWSGADENESI